MAKKNRLFLILSVLCAIHIVLKDVAYTSSFGEGSTYATTYANGFEPEKACDGNLQTQWKAFDGTYPQVLIRSFKEGVEINKVITVFPSPFAYYYTIYTSDKHSVSLNSLDLEDTQTWTKIIGPKIGKGQMVDVFSPPIKAKYIATKLDNLISNSSFEDITGSEISQKHASLVCAGWRRMVKDGGVVMLDSSTSHTGNASVMVTDENLKDGFGVHLYHDFIPVKPNTTYTYSAYVRSSEGKIALVGIRLDQHTLSKDWAKFSDNAEATRRTKWGEFEISTTKWKKFSFTIRTLEDCAYVHPGFFYYKRQNQPQNYFWVDDVFLIEGEDETDIAGIVEQSIE